MKPVSSQLSDFVARFATVLVCFIAASECAAAGQDAVQKKYLSFGWEFKNATPEQLLSNAGKLRGKAIDGVGIHLAATNSEGRLLRLVSKGDKCSSDLFK